jgi:hypothetical protein
VSPRSEPFTGLSVRWITLQAREHFRRTRHLATGGSHRPISLGNLVVSLGKAQEPSVGAGSDAVKKRGQAIAAHLRRAALGSWNIKSDRKGGKRRSIGKE